MVNYNNVNRSYNPEHRSWPLPFALILFHLEGPELRTSHLTNQTSLQATEFGSEQPGGCVLARRLEGATSATEGVRPVVRRAAGASHIQAGPRVTQGRLVVRGSQIQQPPGRLDMG